MAVHAFGTRKRQTGARWLLAGALMASTALVLVPKAEAQQAGFSPWAIDIVSVNGAGTIFAGNQGNDAVVGQVDGQVASVPSIGTLMSASDISRSGNTVVGDSTTADGRNRAWRFVGGVNGGVVTELGTLVPGISNSASSARGVSDNGSRVVGSSFWQGNHRAFVWIEGATGGVAGNEQMYELSGLPGGYNRSSAQDISGDGRYAVGWSDGAGSVEIATRWNLDPLETGGTATAENLGALTGMIGNSWASATSADGSVVVGWSTDVDGRFRAFRWMEGGTNGVASNVQMMDLGSLGGQYSSAESVSRDGRWVVGISSDEDDLDLAFRWSESTGMESVADWLGRQGVSTTGYRLEQALGISDDGTVVVGQMSNDQGDWFGYLARGLVDGGGEEPGEHPGEEPGEQPGGLMNINEYHQTLYAAANIASSGEFLTWLPMNGAHHRPLMLTPSLSGDMCAWATGDFAHHGQSSTNLALAEAGACVDLAGGAVRLGGAVGTTRSWQSLALGGALNMSGQYVLGEVDWQPDGTPLLLSLTGMIGGWQADIDRAYSNGAATAVSSGQTNALGGVVRVRADWLEAAVIGNTSINPWASLAFGGLRVNGYSETGGPFPASFAAQHLGHADIRLGVTAITELSSQTKLSTTLEVAHRSGTAAAAVGQVDGLFNFSLGGGNYAQTWGRLGIELDHAITDAVSVSSSVHLATNGRDPTVAFSAGIKGAF